MKCNKTQSKWCINKHVASKIIDTFETYHHVPPPYRPCVIGLKETGMMSARPWWRLLVGGEAWWWCSFAAKFFCGLGREKSLSACLTLTRCRFRVAPFLPGGHRGKPSSTLLRARETLGPSGPGSSTVSTVFPFLKVLLGSGHFGVLRAWWE
jgi:hypothetical protein